MPKISVVTVCYNAAAEIEETIKNVLSFQNRDIDFIIIDGGSTDGTVDVIKKHQQNLKFWISEPDKGIYDAMNKGWQQADLHSFVIYLGAGDKLLSLPDAKELDLANIYYGDASPGEGQLFVGKKDFRLKFGNTLHHQSLLIPKRLNVDPPFNTTYKVYADFDFNQRLLKRNINYIKRSDLKSYFLPDGFSQHHATFEWFFIIKSNFGILYAIVGFAYFYFQELKKIMR
jgi:glycosyltransferase involved in cell wall biosynthesis